MNAFIGIGSNDGDRFEAVLEAAAGLHELSSNLLISQVYETEPMGPRSNQRYLNCAAKLRWNGSPRALLNSLQRVERSMGRRRTALWGERVIDLDVLLLGDVTMSDRSMTLPHPLIVKRAFVLKPLLEIAPNARSPKTDAPYSLFLRHLPAQGWRVAYNSPKLVRGRWVMRDARSDA